MYISGRGNQNCTAEGARLQDRGDTWDDHWQGTDTADGSHSMGRADYHNTTGHAMTGDMSATVYEPDNLSDSEHLHSYRQLSCVSCQLQEDLTEKAYQTVKCAP